MCFFSKSKQQINTKMIHKVIIKDTLHDCSEWCTK